MEEQGSIREQSTEQQGDRHLPKPCLAVRLFKYRARLARLTSSGYQPSDISVWEDKHVYVRDCARMLKMVIEGSAEVLFSDTNLLKEDWRDTSSLCWAIEVVTEIGRTEQSKASPVFLSVQKETDSNGWEADLSELEAALGLWTWSLLRFPSSARTDTLRRVVAEASQEDRGESAKVDLTIWMEKMKKRPQTEKLDDKKCALPLLGQKSVQAGVKYVLTVPADNPLVFACAQDIFMSFLSAAASILNSLGGQTTPKMGTQGLYLDNDKLSELVKLFCDSNIGSKEDAYLSIVPVLQAKSRLPSVSQCLDTARTTASEARKRGNWKDAENLLQWAWRSSESPEDQKKSVLALGEFYRWAKLEDDEYHGQFDPSIWMAEATSNDTITMEILMRYKEVFKSIPAKDRLCVPSILHATSQNLLVDALALLHPGINTKETDNNGRTSLHWAAIRGWTEVVVGLLEVGAEPDSGDSFQRTALSYASEGGYLEVVQALINAGSFPNKEDKAHRTPLSYAAASGNSSVVQFLIKDARVACDTTDNWGQSSLHWAAKSNSLTVVANLLQASKFKQDFINAEDNVGKTPLIAALENGKADVARLLISEGASCAVQVEGVPAWQWFIEKGNLRSAGFLLQELNNILIAQNNLSELAAKNNAVIYIFLQTAGEPSQHMIDSLEHDYFQPEEDLKITLLNEKWTSCTMKFLENAANEVYEAIASFSEIDQQQVKTTEKNVTTCAIFSFILAYLSEVKVTEEVVMAAAGNEGSGEEILSLLLDRRPEEVKVTQEVVIAAAENPGCGTEILSLLLDHQPEEVKVTEEVVMAAAQNKRSGTEILSLLLDHQPEEVKVTEEVVMAAAENSWSGKEILSLLLDRRLEEVEVTEEVIMAAAGNKWSGKEILSLLLDCRPEEVKVTEEVVMAAARNGVKETLLYLLDCQPEEVKVTNKVFIAAAENEGSGEEILSLLLDRRPEEVKVTQEVVMAAAQNKESGKEILSLLLDCQPEEVKVTKEVVMAAAENWSSGKKILSLLLDRRPEEVEVTEEVVMAAAGNSWSGTEILSLLLDRRPEEVEVTKEVIMAAAGNELSGKEILSLLQDRRPEVKVTKEVVVAAAANKWSGYRILSILLDCRPEEVKVAEEVVMAAAENWSSGKKILSLLLDRRPEEVKVTEEVVMAAAGNGGKETLFYLLDRQPEEIKVTNKVFIAAAGNERFGKEILSLLLDRQPEEVKVTQEVVVAAAGNWSSGKEILSLLLDRRPEEVKVTQEVVMAAADNSWSGTEILSLLLDRRPEEVKVTQEVVMAAARNKHSGEGILSLLLDHQPEVVKFAKEVVMTAAGNECSSEEACSSC